MTDIDKMLDRLLKSAKAAPPQPSSELSWKSQMEVLAEWRRAQGQDDWTSLMRVLRRGVAVACAAAFLALVFNLALNRAETPDEIATLNVAVNLVAME